MVVVLAFFLLVRAGELTGRLPAIASSFADDLLCLPLVLGAALLGHRRILKQGPGFTLPRSHGFMTLTLFAVYFEGMLPHWTERSVADPWDLLMYLIGYLVFEMMMNRPQKNIRQRCCREFA